VLNLSYFSVKCVLSCSRLATYDKYDQSCNGYGPSQYQQVMTSSVYQRAANSDLRRASQCTDVLKEDRLARQCTDVEEDRLVNLLSLEKYDKLNCSLTTLANSSSHVQLDSNSYLIMNKQGSFVNRHPSDDKMNSDSMSTKRRPSDDKMNSVYMNTKRHHSDDKINSVCMNTKICPSDDKMNSVCMNTKIRPSDDKMNSDSMSTKRRPSDDKMNGVCMKTKLENIFVVSDDDLDDILGSL